MKRIAFVLAAALLALGLAILERVSQRSAPSLENAAIDAMAASTSSANDAHGEAESDAGRAHRERAVAPVPYASAEKESDGFSFFVVDGRSKEPVPGAEVKWVEEMRVAQLFDALDFELGDFGDWRPASLAELESLARNSGHRAFADARGFVRLPASGWPMLFGRKDGLVGGSTTLYTEDDLLTLHLWPDGDLRVRVLDASGAPCPGTEVRLIEGHGDWDYVALVASTDANGIATLAHACVDIADNEARGLEPRGTWRISAAALPEEEASVELDPTSLPREPIEIRLPVCGSVEVVVLDPSGSKLASDLPVILEPVEAEHWHTDWDGTVASRSRWRPQARKLSSPIVDGIATFRHVGLGREWRALTARNEASSTDELQFDGPTGANELVRAELVMGADSVILAARLLDPEGAPLADATIGLRFYAFVSYGRPQATNFFDGDPVDRMKSKLVADAQGRITIELRMDAAMGERPLLVVSRSRPGKVPLEQCLDLQDVWQPGLHDLGEVRIGESPILAAGVVVDEAGAPIAGADVTIPRHSSGFFRMLKHPTDEGGRFEIRSAKPYAAVELRVECDGFESSSERIGQPGRSDWRVVLRRESKLLVRIDFPPGTTGEDFSISLHHMESGAVDEDSTVSGGPRDDGTFEWSGCTPGTYALLVHTVEGFDSRTVAKLENLVVRDGETTDAGVIDLSGGASFVTLSVLDPDGKPLQEGAYAAGSNASSLIDELWSARWGKRVEDGKLRLAHEGAIFNVAIAAPGARTRVFADVHDGDVLRLESGIPIVLAISNTVSRPARGLTLQAGLVRAGVDDRALVMSPLRWYTGEFDERDEAKLLAPEPGRYQIKWMLVRKRPGGYQSRDWHDDPAVIEVLDSEELQRFDVRCPIDPATAWDGK